jgi:hypothetical protein
MNNIKHSNTLTISSQFPLEQFAAPSNGSTYNANVSINLYNYAEMSPMFGSRFLRPHKIGRIQVPSAMIPSMPLN